jgi:hypothetical protein
MGRDDHDDSGITVANTAALSPGLGDIGTHTLNGGVTINGSVLTDVSPVTADMLVIAETLH